MTSKSFSSGSIERELAVARAFASSRGDEARLEEANAEAAYIRSELERLRAVAQHETDAAEAYKAQAESLLDCRTCRNYSFFDACLSVIKCVDGAAYQRGGWPVRLWEAA